MGFHPARETSRRAQDPRLPADSGSPTGPLTRSVSRRVRHFTHNRRALSGARTMMAIAYRIARPVVEGTKTDAPSSKV